MIKNPKHLFPALIVTLLSLTILSHAAQAAKLVELRPVDEDYLMVYIKDGDAAFRDNGEGPNAYSGHDYTPGNSRIVSFGAELSTSKAAAPRSWSLMSAHDADYGNEGRPPVRVFRKSKVFSTDHDWNYKLDHWVFLHLPRPLKPGAVYLLSIDPAVGTDRTTVSFTFDLNTSQSEAIHLNLIGYRPDSPVKSADLYLWLGDGGPRDYSDFVGRSAWLYDLESRKRHAVGNVEFWKESATEAENRNLTGSSVWTVDFSDFDRPGRYRLVVHGVGCSAEFEIKDEVWFHPYKTVLRGYYYMRIGEPIDAVVPAPRQPRFIPGKDPEGFTIYLTDLDPFDPLWKTSGRDTWDEPHFKPGETSMFWKQRLPGNPTNPHAIGGHSDALDWDRHLAHVSNIYDMLLPFLLSGGKLRDDDLGIRESGNGIPDLLDEARNEVDLFLNLRVGPAYSQGLTNPDSSKKIMFQAGATNMAAWANAANAAMLAEAFRVSGHDVLMAHYRDEALTAFNYAAQEKEQQLDLRQEVGNAHMRGRDFRMMAAAYLYNLTGDTKWEDVVAEESVVRDGIREIEKGDQWSQIYATAAYLFTHRSQHHPKLVANMREAILKQAEKNNLRYMDERPSRRSSNNNYWQTTHHLHLVVLAHALAEDPVLKERCLKAMILDADWGLGRNPSNMVEMTGLGSRCVVNCYTTGRNDGTPGLHPGHTPYHNLDRWGGGHNGSNPRWFTDRGYPDWDEGWPHQEGHFNTRYSWANAEFTPRQTMRGKMLLYAYLHSLSL